MKNQLKKLAFFLFAGALVFSSCDKDKFTEEDALEALQEIGFIVAVTDATNNDVPLGSANVKIVYKGETVQKTTDSTGTAVFEDIQIGGNMNVYVTKDGYTTIFTSVSTLPGDYRQSIVNKSVRLYSLSDEKMFTVKGKLTIESDLTNRTRETVPEGTEVIVQNSYIPAGIQENYVGTTDANGEYSVKVPVNGTGNDRLNIYFPEINATQKLALIKNDGSRAVVDRQTKWEPDSYSESYIYHVPSPVMNIAAPVSQGTGLAFTTEVDTNTGYFYEIIGRNLSNVKILKQGSGYFPNIENNDTTVWVFLNPDDAKKDTARLWLRFEKNGGLVQVVSFDNNGATSGRLAKYTSKPTINLNVGGGSGAEIYFPGDFDYKIRISNNGSGYYTIPDVRMTYFNNGAKLIKDLSMGSAMISEGSIYAIGGDVLAIEYNIDEAPSFEVVAENSVQAMVDYDFWYNRIDETDSTMNDNISLDESGLGYDYANPPTVTVSSLAGYGTGAEYRAEVNTNGQVTDIEQIQIGSGYVQNVNDYRGLGFRDQNGEDGDGSSTYYHYSARPGGERVINIYYGTGMALEEL